MGVAIGATRLGVGERKLMVFKEDLLPALIENVRFYLLKQVGSWVCVCYAVFLLNSLVAPR